MTHLSLVTDITPDYRDPVKMLRNIADEIEAGDYGVVTTVAVALHGDTMDVFGGGADSGSAVVALLFNAAGLRFARTIEEHGQ